MQITGTADKAPSLYDLNSDKLKLPSILPAGTALKVPQKTWPAIVAFGVLTLFLAAVGLGWWLKPPAVDPGKPH